jgi:hypothetical protein
MHDAAGGTQTTACGGKGVLLLSSKTAQCMPWCTLYGMSTKTVGTCSMLGVHQHRCGSSAHLDRLARGVAGTKHGIQEQHIPTSSKQAAT